MLLRLDDWLDDGEKLYVFDTRVLARRLNIDGRILAPIFREAVLVSEAAKIGSKVVMSERMVGEYFPDLADDIAGVAKDMARIARVERKDFSVQIESYKKSVFVNLEGLVDDDFAKGSLISNEAKAELTRLKALADEYSKKESAYEHHIAELECLLRERSAQVGRAARDSQNDRHSYEARIAELESMLASRPQVDDKEVKELRSKTQAIPQYEARIEALMRENQRVRALLDDEKKNRPVEEKVVYALKTDDSAARALEAERESGALLRKKIEHLERELRRERKAAKAGDNTILVPADEFNELCDKVEGVDELLEEIEALRAQVKKEKTKVYVEDEMERDKRGAAAQMADNSGKVVAVYGGSLFELQNDLHLYRAYEVLHAMKLHGEKCEQGVRISVESVSNLVSDAENKDTRLRAYERWKRHIAQFDIPFISLPKGYDEAQFCVRDFENTYAKVRDLLALRDIYDSDHWRGIKRLAKGLGLVNLALSVDPLEAIFKYPSQSSQGDEVRPLRQDDGRDVPEKDYRVLRQGQQG